VSLLNQAQWQGRPPANLSLSPRHVKHIPGTCELDPQACSGVFPLLQCWPNRIIFGSPAERKIGV